MVKELKYFFFVVSIFCFLFFTIKYYFSNENIKHSFRSMNNIDTLINKYEKDLIVLSNNTENIIEYTDQPNMKKKKYYFWDLLKKND